MSDLSRPRPRTPVVGVADPARERRAARHRRARSTPTTWSAGTTDVPARPPGAGAARPRPGHRAATPSRRYAVPGVVRVLTAADVPGVNDAGVKHDEPLFPDEVMFFGHAVCWVLGETLEAARLGAAAVEVDYEPLPRWSRSPRRSRRESFQGAQPDAGARRRRRPGCAGAAHVFEGEFEFAGQEHFYLETHCRAGHVDENGQVFVQSQHPAPDARPRRSSRTCSGLHEPRGHRAVPADGRRLRRQGDAAARLRGDRRARRHADRPAGAAAAQPAPRT